MAKQSTKSAARETQSMFDPKNYQDVMKTWAGMGERLSTIGIDAVSASTDIATETANESFGNMRDLMTVRDEPADYGKAYSDFVQKQMELSLRAMQSFAEVTQKAGSETTDVASKAGEEMGEKIASNVDQATDKARSAAQKAA